MRYEGSPNPSTTSRYWVKTRAAANNPKSLGDSSRARTSVDTKTTNRLPPKEATCHANPLTARVLSDDPGSDGPVSASPPAELIVSPAHRGGRPRVQQVLV